VTLELGLGTSTLRLGLRTVPGCDDPNQSSKLGQAPPLEPTPAWADGTQTLCDPATLVTDIDASGDGPGGARLITLKVTSQSRGCTIDTGFTVSLQREDGTPLDIAGNGRKVQLSATAADPAAVVTLSWANWCGDPGPFQIAVEGDSSSAGAGPVIPPACADAGEPSTLVASAPAPIDPTATPGLPNALPACPEEQVSYTADTQGAEGTRFVGALVEGPGKVGCVVDEHITFTIVDADGTPLDIAGNGLTAAANGPEPAIIEAWVGWSNWCGDTGTFQANVSGEAGTTTIAVDSPPCVDAGAPSELAITPSPFPQPAPTPDATEQPLPPTPTPSPATDLPDCANGDYQLALNGGPGLTGGQIGFGVTATVESKPCRIDGGVTFTLLDANGAPLDVDDNGATVPLDAWPKDYAPQASFVWSNWCGGDIVAHAEVTTADGTSATMVVDPLPTCMSGPDAAPSTLLVTVSAKSGT
jgi:hypothetical protein